jgi:PBP1b-binding outer membrane lipoprotein LpoB
MNKQLPAWLTLLAAVLGGCAQINWERAVYDGVRVNAENEARRIGPTALPDPQLPSYEDYDKERSRLRRAQ